MKSKSNWRIRRDVLTALNIELTYTGLTSITQLVSQIFFEKLLSKDTSTPGYLKAIGERVKRDPTTKPVNWLLRTDVVDAIEKEAVSGGYKSIPALVNRELFLRYFKK